MKLIITGLLTLFTLTSVQANCLKAYETKAENRAQVVKNLKITAAVTGGVVIGVGGVVVAPILLLPIASTVPAAALGLGGALMVGGISSANIIEKAIQIRPTKNNQYYKVLAAMEAAKEDLVSSDLLEQINKQVPLDKLPNERKATILKEIADIVKYGNNTEFFCQENYKGKVELKNYKDVVGFVVRQLGF